MQISVDTEILETILTYARTAARITGYIDNATVGGALNKTINEIIRMVAEALGRPSVPRLIEKLPQDGKSKFDVATAVDDLRQAVAKADALANAASSLLDETPWGSSEHERRRFERLGHLIDAAFEAVQSAMVLGDKLALELLMRRTARNSVN